MPIRPRSPAASTATVTNGVASNAPFLITRSVPPCSAMKRRPSGACANAVALVRPVSHDSLRVKPFGARRRAAELDRRGRPGRDVARGVGGARAQHVLAGRIEAGVERRAVRRGGVGGAERGPSIWNSTLATATLSAAVAATAIVPVRPLAKAAGAVRAAVGSRVSAAAGGGLAPDPLSSEPPPQAARTAALIAASTMPDRWMVFMVALSPLSARRSVRRSVSRANVAPARHGPVSRGTASARAAPPRCAGAAPGCAPRRR